MAYKVLVVDDSSFFRRRVTDILNKDPKLNVIDVAVNGQEAVDKALLLKPDVITMDIEMPILNGIEAVRKIMAQSPTSILMFSSLTHQGAKATLEALDAGALDFLPKKFSEIAKNSDEAGSLLRQRVVEIARKSEFSKQRTRIRPTAINISPKTSRLIADQHKPLTSTSSLVTKDKKAMAAITRSSGKEYKLLAIGTSTGGPVALQKILVQLEENFPLPIIIVQHMPAAFTAAFASRLNSLCKISIKEAADGDILKAGCAYLAPGGRQMLITGSENSAKIKILDDDSPKITFKPSVDISFGSAAKTFAGKVLGVILTGMGSDGKEGARMLKAKGATIWSQDEQSCVVYGMPQAIDKAGISELSLSLDSMAASMVKEISRG
ncbi:chemotaxis response regulator protein-glutamate methylesterase [Colwellia demingiae]|uniref:Protein-glutamate methylesterase/protein-glutamine glutaminase n=1 Tax=Colwellia demingiae TaxID=89401 RepID=A0A5C6QKK9_9GAMM|nr:chemotaxis response regulator protein-glutamate methylesterase [Colwellia demingiae]TWX69514.1 chemotaxis response regulator protein-glutamate methylesterase [Colwellia demingiae]